jgi:hypothetical protein
VQRAIQCSGERVLPRGIDPDDGKSSGVGELNEDVFGPQLTTGVPVFLASDRARDVTGCTVGLARGDFSFISDPERERTLSNDLEADGR